MAGSLCLPVCFIAVVYCLELIFVYQISILRKAGGGGSSAVSRTKKLFAASRCVGFFLFFFKKKGQKKPLEFPYYKEEEASFRYNGAINIY